MDTKHNGLSTTGETALAVEAVAVRTVPLSDDLLEASNEYLAIPKSVRTASALERMIRCFVRKDGGYRKGLHVHDRNHAMALLQLAGRVEPEWDHSITLPRD